MQVARMAGETWKTMPEELQNLRVMISANNNLQSLKNLCLVKVADTLDFYCTEPKQNPPHRPRKRSRLDPATVDPPQYHEPFKDLPVVLMSSLQRILEKGGFTFTPGVLLYLISENTVRLEAHIGYWSKMDKEALIKRIIEKGQNICELDLRLGWCKEVSPVLLQSMLGALTNLTVLELQEHNFGDSFLATVGSCCPELRKLTLNNMQITDEGLRYLYDSNISCGPNGEKYGKCKKLAYLDVKGCNVTVDGLATVLSNLPDLVYLDRYDHYQILAKYAQSNETKLKLQYLYLGSEKLENLAAISKVPDIRKLEIEHHDIKNVDEFLKLEYVTDLTMCRTRSLSSSQVTSLITHFSHQLTKLKLIRFDMEVDITIIGFHCRHLVEFFWTAKYTSDTKYKLIPSVHFNKLKEFHPNPSHDDEFTFPDYALKCILASPCLEQLCSPSYKVLDRPDCTLSWLVEEARTHRIVFSNLQALTLHQDVSSLMAKQIICVAPKLKVLNVPPSIYDNVNFFMRLHNLSHCQVNALPDEDMATWF